MGTVSKLKKSRTYVERKSQNLNESFELEESIGQTGATGGTDNQKLDTWSNKEAGDSTEMKDSISEYDDNGIPILKKYHN